MATLIVEVNTAKTEATLARDYERPVSSKYATVQAVADLVQSVSSGNQKGDNPTPPTVNVSIKEGATQATGTFTLTSVIATDACSVNAVGFTCVASGATGNQFNVGADDDETADNLVAAINGSATALLSGYVVASKTSSAASPAVVTITSTNYGIYGNLVTLGSSDATIVVSGARLTGGAADAGAKSYTF